MTVLEILERALPEGALIFGSLPPAGRDLDLLVRPDDERAAANALEAAGFRRRAQQWIRFAGCEVESVDLVPAGSWDLPAADLADLFANGRGLPQHERLLAPAPHHVVLILARRVQAGDELTPKRRQRLEAALGGGGAVWDHAAARATAWNVQAGLKRLRELHAGGKTHRSALPRNLRSRPRLLIALSGMDGSGKSSLAEAFVEMIRKLGHEPVIVWNRLAVNPSLDVVAVPVKRLLRPFLRRRGTSAPPSSDGEEAIDPGTALRASSGWLTQIWTCFVATWNAMSHRRSAWSHLLRGRVVVCDRYSLDSAVNLRFEYGIERRFRFQRWIVERLSPTPTLAFHIAVPAALAHERKPVKFTLEELEIFEQLYEEERDDSIVRLDGARPRAELCETVGWALWDKLGE